MLISKKNLIILFVLGLLAVTFYQQKKQNPFIASPSPTEQLKIISTNPHPLEEATIYPTQNIELTFNKPFFRSQFKHKFDPDIEHEVEVIGGRDKEFGQTFKIVFKKPLELGLGYTLFIFTNTKTEENFSLDKEYVFHFQTIKYKGF